MATQITYREKITSANTIYTEMDKGDKLYMISKLTDAFYTLVERSNYDNEAKEILLTQHKDFNKHIASGNVKLNNSLGSFMSGLLKQHHKNPDKDISNKMLAGIELASQVFAAVGIDCPEYKFVKENSKRISQDPFSRLFGTP